MLALPCHAIGVKSNDVKPDEIEPTRPIAIAAAIIATRYRLSPCMARLVCHLAHIGGKLA